MPVSPNRKSNILIVVDGLKLGGLARVLIDLSAGFTSRGLHVGMIVLAPRIDYELTASQWMRVYPEVEPTFGPLRVRYRQRLSAFIIAGIAAFEAQCGPADLIIAAGEMTMRCAAHIDHPNLLLSSHSSQLQSPKYANWYGQLKYQVKTLRRRWRVRQMFSGKNVHVVSDGLAQELITVLRARPMSVTTIYNPFDFERIRELGMQSTPESMLQVREFIIGIGEFNYRKSFELLIRAFSQCQFKGDLVLVGQGSDERKLRQLVLDSGLEERVKLLPFHANHYALLRRAKLLVSTSRSEGFGNVLVEALMLGVPALSVDCPHGPKDILLPICSEALIAPDRLDLLPERIDRFVAQPYVIEPHHLRRFTRDFVLDQYLALIGQL
jgi:glycosyltransferase involved in cell wall biosynthesis